MIYLASPYSHPDAEVRQQRFDAVCQVAAALLRRGQMLFSPIAHSHPIARYGLPKDWAFWRRYDRLHLERCGELVVLMLDGWRESIGVAAEIDIAGELGKPVRYLEPSNVLEEMAKSTPVPTGTGVKGEMS